jgi:chromate reductase, NAD(P)H dehydrogenase (quinone)
MAPSGKGLQAENIKNEARTGRPEPAKARKAAGPRPPTRPRAATIAGMKLLIFAGSTRLNSFNRKLAHVAADLARASGADVTHLELADFDVPMYNADLEAQGTPPDVMQLKQIMYAHPAWIICSPEYNGSYTALLKNTIDWVSSPVKSDPAWQEGFKSFTGKVVGVLSASPGALGGLRSQSHLVPLLLNTQCWVAPKTFALGRAGDAFDATGQLLNEAHRRSVQAVIDQVLWAGTRLKN